MSDVLISRPKTVMLWVYTVKLATLIAQWLFFVIILDAVKIWHKLSRDSLHNCMLIEIDLLLSGKHCRRNCPMPSMQSRWHARLVLKSTLCQKISSRWSQRWWWQSLHASWSATISRSPSANRLPSAVFLFSNTSAFQASTACIAAVYSFCIHVTRLMLVFSYKMFTFLGFGFSCNSWYYAPYYFAVYVYTYYSVLN